ncbi:MAG: DM13 domain-containing protein [Pseudonocardia sp.]
MTQRPPVQPPYRGGPPARPGPPPGPPRGPHRPAAAPPPPPYLATAPTVPHRLPRMPRRFPFGLVAGIAVIVFILLTKPTIIVQTLTTPVALLIVAAIVGALLLTPPVLRRLRTPPAARAVVVGVAWLVAGYLLIWPFYSDYLFPAPVSQAAAPVQIPATGGASASAAVSGEFAGLDGHRGSGEASLIQVADGTYVVRLAGVDIGSGPDLRAYLVPGAGRESPGEGAVELGRLGNSVRGDVNLPVPAGTDVAAGEPYTVLVWCRPFMVPVAGATLA